MLFGKSRLFLVAVSLITGRVLFFVSITANKPATNYAGRTTNQGTFAAANYGTRHGTRAATNGCAFGFIAPAFFGRLSLHGRASQNEKHQQKRGYQTRKFHDSESLLWIRMKVGF